MRSQISHLNHLAFGEKISRRAGLRQISMCALSRRMRRERLIRPTKTCKFNILQDTCRPDKRSASGNFAFGEKKTRRAGLEISRKEYLTERRSRSVPRNAFFQTSDHRSLTGTQPYARIVVFLVRLIFAFRVTQLTLQISFVRFVVVQNAFPGCPLGIGIDVHFLLRRSLRSL